MSNNKNTPQKINAELKKQQFLALFEDKACNVSQTCKDLNIDRGTYYYWCDQDESFKLKCIEMRESLIDFAESQLMKNIKDGKETSLIFFLKCQAKHRGYIEKPKVEVEDKTIIETIQIIDD